MRSTTDRRRRATAAIVALLLVTAASAEAAMHDAQARPRRSSSGPTTTAIQSPVWEARRLARWDRDHLRQEEIIRLIERALPREAARLAGCAEYTLQPFDRRCSSRLCAFGEPRKRRAFARKAERALRRHEGVKLLLTCTIGSTTIAGGLGELRAATTRLRASVAWTRAVLVAAHGIEVERCVGVRQSGARWNLHAHAVAIVEPGSAISRLRSAWSATWARAVGTRGSLDVRRWRRDPRWRGRGDGSLSYACKVWRPLVVPGDGLSAAAAVEKWSALYGRRLRGIVTRREVA